MATLIDRMNKIIIRSGFTAKHLLLLSELMKNDIFGAISCKQFSKYSFMKKVMAV